MSTALLTTNIPVLPLKYRGKVRDTYEVNDGKLLIVTTDRISAFDVVLPNGIPDKGRVLNQMSLFWFEKLGGIVKNHLVTADLRDYPPELMDYADQLEGRSMIVKRVEILPVECIVRGYLAGSGWKDYQKTGSVCGHILPHDLRESERLPNVLFTPSTKAESGHDENINFSQACDAVGQFTASKLRELSVRSYSAAAEYARTRSIIIADTKFEFGLDEDANLVLADEALTPDSSRFWDAAIYRPGGPQDSFDKQYVRDCLEGLRWNKQPPGPILPDDVIARTREKYLEAYECLVGKPLAA